MSDIGGVVGYYESAQEAENEHKYLLAARYYRMCSYAYECGDLPYYMDIVKEYGESANGDYFRMCRKLTHEQRMMLLAEQQEGVSDWRKFIAKQYDLIMKESEEGAYTPVLEEKTEQSTSHESHLRRFFKKLFFT